MTSATRTGQPSPFPTPHISFEQARHFTEAVFHRDAEAGDMIKQAAKDTFAAVKAKVTS